MLTFTSRGKYWKKSSMHDYLKFNWYKTCCVRWDETRSTWGIQIQYIPFCCKYYNICGCLCKYSLVMSLRCKSYSYIRESNENERDTSSSSYILFFSFLSISFLVYNTLSARYRSFCYINSMMIYEILVQLLLLIIHTHDLWVHFYFDYILSTHILCLYCSILCLQLLILVSQKFH